MRFIHWLALILVVIGALNWGAWGFFQLDVVSWIFKGPSTAWSRIIYSLIGLAGLWCISFFTILAGISLEKKKK